MNSLLGGLAAIEQVHPLERKLLVAPDLIWGRELLLSLARSTGGWVGWDVVTVHGMAEQLAFAHLGGAGARQATDTQLAVLVDRALAATIARGALSGTFGDLARGLGFRRAVKDAVLTLRAAGIAAEDIEQRVERHAPAWDAAQVLREYEGLLDAGRLVDPAALLRAALENFDDEAPFVLAPVMVLSPDLMTSGLARQLLDRVVERGAQVLPAPRPDAAVPVRSVLSRAIDVATAPAEAPARAADFFAAKSPADEIREVLRRAMQEGLSWDQIEIVATERDAYGVALASVSAQLGIRCTLLDGVPLARTRAGRALERWLAWLDAGLPADLLREALEAGDLDSPPVDGSIAARLLRRLHVGWGRARYEAALGELESPGFTGRLSRGDDETDEQFAARRARRQEAGDALRTLLRTLLGLLPPVPERGVSEDPDATAGELAHALEQLLLLLPDPGPSDRRTCERVLARLGELVRADTTAVPFGLAMAEVRDAIADVRAWSDTTPVERPRLSAGGAVHLTDMVHAGVAGRPRTFVVGLDADRVAGPHVQDPILTDSARRLIGGALPSAAERRDEHRWRVAAMMARLEGRVTLSCSLGNAGTDAVASPAHAMLEAWRGVRGSPALGYREFRDTLGEPASPAPAATTTALDVRDAWLAAIAGGAGEYRTADAAVRTAFPQLATGLAALERRFGPELSPWQGQVPAAAGRLDPRQSRHAISPTSLELLASCPLAWFYRHGLRISPPDDPEYDPESWLDALQRGSLLHGIYERFALAYEGHQAAILDRAAEPKLKSITEALLAEWRQEVPPPSETVFDGEAEEIRASALAFLEAERASVREGTTRWAAFELAFGGSRAIHYEVQGGSIPVRGRIDRVDRATGDRLVVIDYKTGSPRRYEPDRRTGPFKGGRLLQPAVYADAARVLLDAEVARFEYRFPTVRGENRAVAYHAEDFATARAIIGTLLRHVEHGEFIPTTDEADCRYCDFAAICRVTPGRFGRVDSPRAAWASAHAEELAAYAQMHERRQP